MITGAETPNYSNILAGERSNNARSLSAITSKKEDQNDTEQSVAASEQAIQAITEANVDIAGQNTSGSQISTGNFKQVIQEFQERLSDDSRIPPSIFNQMRELLANAQAKSAEASAESNVDQSA